MIPEEAQEAIETIAKRTEGIDLMITSESA
jgi:hypothetical protein